MIIPVDMRTHHWTDTRGRVGRFQPNGRIAIHGARPNKATKFDSGVLGARIFVGLKVGDEVRWDVEHVVALIKRIRATQTENVGASFISQRGLYTASDKSLVDEPSVQVVIIDQDGLSLDVFAAQMIALGEALTRELAQEMVIVEIQRAGVTQATFGVEP